MVHRLEDWAEINRCQEDYEKIMYCLSDMKNVFIKKGKSFKFMECDLDVSSLLSKNIRNSCS